ncbi:MAG: hemolysin family protein [Candidatus Omnitrophota bacterium]|nr:hemolysin family protein [Candidatus Omnitrophota bacterium]
MQLGLNLLIFLLLFALATFFAGAETALFSLSRIERRRLERGHPRLGGWVNDHLDNPKRTLATILIGNLVVHTLATAMVTLIAKKVVGHQGIGFSLVIFTLLLVLFGEILPKTFAVRNNEVFSLFVAIPLKIFSFLFYPFRVIARLATDRILGLLIHEKIEHKDKMSEEELMTLIKIGEEEGVLDRQERYMLHKLFDLGQRQVKEIMTPRVDLAALDIEDSADSHVEMMRKYHFTHFPVYQGSSDHVLGVISVDEYLLSRTRDLRSLLQQPLFVPESKRIDDLLEEFREKRQKFAICVDEFGGTAGIVTLEDILEEIFGEYYDEYAEIQLPVRAIGENRFIVEAKMNLADFNEYFSTHLQADDAATLGGFILERLGEVPARGKTLKTDECEITIHEVIRQRRIRSVIVRPRP